MSETQTTPLREWRTDSIEIDDKRYSKEGFFFDTPILTRTGIFEYPQPDGTVRRELRRPEDVFDSESLASYEGKPIIITHDAQQIDTDNVRREEVGCILSPGQQDGENVRAKIVLHDPSAVKASGLRALSLGYFQTLIMQPGVWEGKPYDAIQTNIRVNHLALVAVARAGENAHLNMDGQDNGGNTQMDENKKNLAAEGDNPAATQQQTDPTTDEGEGAAPAPNKAAFEKAWQAYVAAMAGATADDGANPADGADPTKTTQDDGEGEPAEGETAKPDALAEITARRDEMEDGQAKADINTLLSMLEAAEARADAAEDESKSAEKLNHDSAESMVEAKVRQRVELIRLGERLNLDGIEALTDDAAKKKVIQAVMPTIRLDGKNSAYIDAAYDIAKDKANARKTVNDQRAQTFNADAANAATQQKAAKKYDPDAARQRMIARNSGEKED